jgi:hypothetical protein
MTGGNMRTLKALATVTFLLTFYGSASACTVFFAFDGELALAGNNEDHANPETRIWFLPAEEGKHGRVYFGCDD